jgi:predicted aconitase with swiveling domain
VLGEPDAIIALGALVATELYGTSLPVVVAPGAAFATGDRVTVDTAGDPAIVRS